MFKNGVSGCVDGGMSDWVCTFADTNFATIIARRYGEDFGVYIWPKSLKEVQNIHFSLYKKTV